MTALGPLPPAANILRVAISGLKSLQPWANILHYAWSGATPTVSTLTTIADDIANLWGVHVSPRQTFDTLMNQVKITDLTSDTGAQVEVPINALGSNGEDPLPSSVCVLIDYPINLRYRGGHPRTYLVAGGDGDLEPGAGDWNTWNPIFLGNVGAGWADFTSGVEALSAGGTNVDHQKLVRYIHKPHGGVPAYLIPPEQVDINTFTLSAPVASQRRRTGRRRQAMATFAGIKTRSGAIVQPPGDEVIHKFDFSFNTPGLTTGVTVFAPTAGDILVDCWVEIDTAFNGTTPKIDVGDFGSANTGWFAEAHTAPLDATSADAASASGPLLLSNINSLGAVQPGLNGAGIHASSRASGKFTSSNPVKLVCTQNGQKGGAATGATQGAGTVYFLTNTPVQMATFAGIKHRNGTVHRPAPAVPVDQVDEQLPEPEPEPAPLRSFLQSLTAARARVQDVAPGAHTDPPVDEQLPTRPVHTAELWSSGPVGAGTHASPAVPAGVRWVVRDINVLNGLQRYHALGGFQLFDQDGRVMFWVGPADATGGQLYQWHGRQSIDQGGELVAITLDDEWQWRITGYVLTLP